jgi:hypothetical protein
VVCTKGIFCSVHCFKCYADVCFSEYFYYAFSSPYIHESNWLLCCGIFIYFVLFCIFLLHLILFNTYLIVFISYTVICHGVCTGSYYIWPNLLCFLHVYIISLFGIFWRSYSLYYTQCFGCPIGRPYTCF